MKNLFFALFFLITSCDDDKVLKMSTLKNGLKIVTYKRNEKNTVGVSLQVNTGAINENHQNNGVAHFLEHLAFKGTPKRSSEQLWQEIRKKGAYVNAHTGFHEVTYKVKILKEDLEFALDVVSDIVQNPLLEDSAIEKERGVILQEMLSYEDDISYSSGIFALKNIYKGDQLISKIGGEVQSIKNIKKTDIQEFMSKYYFGENMILSVTGNVKHKDIVRLAQKYFDKLESRGGKTEFKKFQYNAEGGLFKKHTDANQVIVRIVFEGASMHYDKKPELISFFNVLCSGMSSRLYKELRQKHGLVYAIECGVKPMLETGISTITFATTKDKVKQAYDAIILELSKIYDTITEDELNEVLNKARISLLMSEDSTDTLYAAQIIGNGLMLNIPISNDDILKRISEINISEVKSVFKDMIERSKFKKPIVVIYGNYDEATLPDYSKIENLHKIFKK